MAAALAEAHAVSPERVQPERECHSTNTTINWRAETTRERDGRAAAHEPANGLELEHEPEQEPGVSLIRLEPAMGCDRATGRPAPLALPPTAPPADPRRSRYHRLRCGCSRCYCQRMSQRTGRTTSPSTRRSTS